MPSKVLLIDLFLRHDIPLLCGLLMNLFQTDFLNFVF